MSTGGNSVKDVMAGRARLNAVFDELPAPVDPRTLSEDAVTEWIDRASEFEQATMVQALNARGWSYEKALHIRQREWRKG